MPRARQSSSAVLQTGCLVACCAALSLAVPASGQRLADSFNEATHSATGPAIPSTGGQAAPAFVPNVPGSPSRPSNWPTAPATQTDVEKHVLSSIRARPGAPLDGDEIRPLSGDETADGEVVQAQHLAPADAPLHEAQSLAAAMVVARVGPEVVLEADLLTPKALEWLAQVTPGLPPEKVRELRLQICQQVLPSHIETLLVYVDACREIPGDKLPEIRQNVDKAFDEQQLPRMMQEDGSANSLEFEQKLRSQGMSLDRMRKMFFERGLAQEWLRKNVGEVDEIPHADLIAWYQNHLSDYDFPAKARFEALTVKMGLKRSRSQAWDMLAAMGNEVLGGRPFAEVAKDRSEGPTARQGGGFDWTGQGSLASKTLDEAIFSLPVGELSAIIEDGETLHIVRVVERIDAGRTPFLEAQVGIRETLLEERRRTATDEYLAKLRDRTPVWTVFDDPSGTAAEPTFTAGRPTTVR
jgi:hypothetical protein